MNLRRLININSYLYLYEIIDEYKCVASKSEQNDIFKSFCSCIWSSSNKRHTYTKTIHFKIKEDLTDTEIGQIFIPHCNIEYTGYKSRTKDTDWCSLIRQKINNLYTKYFDRNVILNRDYMYLLKTPKRLYHQWIDGIDMKSGELYQIISDSAIKAENLKQTYQKQKMCLSWDNYKNIIDEFLLKTINNCKLIENYESKQSFTNIYDFTNEDNFYISYFCKSLEYEMMKWEKQYYGLKRKHTEKYGRCTLCGSLYDKKSNNQKYCCKCSIAAKRSRQKDYMRKLRSKC